MYLINTYTYELEEKLSKPPEYAILSHRWTRDMEVSFAGYNSNDFLYPNPNIPRASGKGKIFNACQQAKSRGLNWLWVDTCCIDKRSSADLSESINSMWRYYEEAKECYAYLYDVEKEKNVLTNDKKPSDWFKRGWTLQELLAPARVIFFDTYWNEIGQKTDPWLLKKLSWITMIPEDCLTQRSALDTACVAKKFSWAAERTTTRPEDMAYCLLGLVGVNMTLMYGEGDKAFQRLQQEIIRHSDDESVFAWRDFTLNKLGILAPSVKNYKWSGEVRRKSKERPPYTITNKGLKFKSSDASRIIVNDTEIYIIPLNCEYGGKRVKGSVRLIQECAIALTQPADSHSWIRVAVKSLGAGLHTTYPVSKRKNLPPVKLYIKLQEWQDKYDAAYHFVYLAIKRMAERKRREQGKVMPPTDGMAHMVQRVISDGMVPAVQRVMSMPNSTGDDYSMASTEDMTRPSSEYWTSPDTAARPQLVRITSKELESQRPIVRHRPWTSQV